MSLKILFFDINPNYARYVVDITNIPFNNDSFDYIICSHVLGHIIEEKKAIEELQIQDGSLQIEPIESNILGPGFRCGFLGLLHKEIIQERIEKELNRKPRGRGWRER